MESKRATHKQMNDYKFKVISQFKVSFYTLKCITSLFDKTLYI